MKATEDIQIEFLNRIGRRIKEFDEKHGWIDYFIAPVIVTVILLTVYAIKGVYPFGVNTIAYYDMPTNHVTGYSWMWDVFHGRAGLYLNWNQGLGVSMATGGDAFFPINWFFFFTSRDGILYALSYFLMIKLELIAFTISYYSKKHFDSTFITVCIGVLYAFSGFVLQYYTNIFFLDFVIMFPLIVHALEKLLFDNKPVFFLIIMFFVFICNIQLVFTVCLYLVFKTYVFLNKISREQKGRALKLLTASVISAGLMACFVIIPEYLQLSGSVRMQSADETFDYMDAMHTIYNYFRGQKHFIIYGSEISVGVLLVLLLNERKKLHEYWDNIVMIVILGMPIIHEGINLLWHAGSYKHFPIRFGYMLTFECLMFFGKYIKNEEFKNIRYIGKTAKLFGVAMLPFYAYVLYDFFKDFLENGISDLKSYHTYWIYFITLTFGYFIIMFMETKGSKEFATIVLIIIQVSLGCYGFIAPSVANHDTYRIKYIVNSIETRNQMTDGKPTDRIKLNMEEYDANDGLIIGQPTVTYWTYGINADTETELHENMGYSGISTCIMDTGGTVFTDALLGVKKFASSYNPDARLYIDDPARSRIQDCIYTLPFGIVFDNDEVSDESNSLEYNNSLFEKLVINRDDLINIENVEKYLKKCEKLSPEEEQKLNDYFIENGPKDAYIIPEEDSTSLPDVEENSEESSKDVEKKDEGNLNKYELQVPVSVSETVYLALNDDFSGNIMIVVDDKPLYMDSFMSHGSFTYPNEEINGILPLGSYNDDYMDILIYTSNEDLKGIDIGMLDLDVLKSGIDKISTYQELDVKTHKNGMNVTGTVNKNGTLFFPISYSENWRAKINGKKIDVRPFLNNAFIGIDVEKGDVDIEFSYIPKGLIIGIVLSFLGISFSVVLVLFIRRGTTQGRKHELILDKIFVYGFNFIVAVLFIIMYVVPICIKMSL